MARNNGGGRPGLKIRREHALARLEQQYKEFKAAGQDKAPHTSTRNGKLRQHPGRAYEAECHRLEREIGFLKAKLNRAA